jgi:hypothetical protein
MVKGSKVEGSGATKQQAKKRQRTRERGGGVGAGGEGGGGYAATHTRREEGREGDRRVARAVGLDRSREGVEGGAGWWYGFG